MKTIIKVGTITNAQRSIRLLRNKGISCSINRITNPNESDGCGYVVELNNKENTETAISVLRKNRINIKGVENGDIS